MILLLLAGESSSANTKSLTDVWELHAPSNNGWSDASSLDGKRAQNSSPNIGTTGTWEYLILFVARWTEKMCLLLWCLDMNV